MNMGYTAAGWTYLADEHHIYGSSRVGVHNTHFVLAKRFSTAEMEYTQKTGNQVHFIRGKRNYELSNHLGNVQVVISDKRISVCDNELQTERFEADILMATDYYPFGMAIPERQWCTGLDSSNYRFGFNGMEKDNEAKGPGNSLDFGARIYDSRLGRFLSTDPLMKNYPGQSSFSFAANSPFSLIDSKGKNPDAAGKERNLTNDEIKILFAGSSLEKINLLKSLKTESKTTTIVVTGAMIIAAGNELKIDMINNQSGQIEKIDKITFSSGVANVDLVDGTSSIKLKGEKGPALRIKDNASADLNGLKVEEKTMTEFKGNPKVQDISGEIKLKGFEISATGNDIDKVTFKSSVVLNKSDNSSPYYTYDTAAEIEINFVPDFTVSDAVWQSLGPKK